MKNPNNGGKDPIYIAAETRGIVFPCKNVEIRTEEGFDGLDEFIAHGCDVHLERMDAASWWIGITMPDSNEFHLCFGAHNQRARTFCRIQHEQSGQYWDAMQPDKEICRAGGAE